MIGSRWGRLWHPPARGGRLLVIQLDGLADHRGEQGIRPVSTGRPDSLERFVPGMAGNGEAPYVSRQQYLGMQIRCGFGRLFRRHVDVGPARVVLPHVEGDQIETAEALSDVREMGTVTGVATEQDAPLGRLEDKSGPQGLAAGQQSARVVACGDQMERCRGIQRQGVVPVALPDGLREIALTFEVGAYAQRHQRLADLISQGGQRRVIKVIPVVMGDQQYVDRRQILDCVEIGASKGRG